MTLTRAAVVVLALGLLVGFSKYDDSAIRQDIDELTDRVTSL
jgi:hypothetical protein